MRILPATAERRRTQLQVAASGSTTALPLVADLAYLYGRAGPDAPRFAIVGGGSETGIVDAARGITSVGMVSRELTAQDPPRLVLMPIALSGVWSPTARTRCPA